ncbi:Xanthine/uracil/thiamine/ascorbate permease family protein [hydrothermal vent metagenome]|uniref:Xanthine/uracil/thiamine/ascorbate permease family protein n=1 Tax=hydrothermal vent metagenome TaxID=652676 RepID=A0A3B0ULJ5_9ZZZZ
MLNRFFRLKENGTSVRTEILAGVTTFMTMAYILAVNPEILSNTGMDRNALFTATALSAFIATLVMAFVGRLPFALAPGMGLNAFFAFSVVLGMGYSWHFALTAVFIEGIIFLILTMLNIRELIVKAIPLSLKHAMSVGIGLFIAFIGMQNAGIIVKNDAVLVGLGNMNSPAVLIAVSGVILTAVLLSLRVKGALLIGIFVATLAGIPFGVTHMPSGKLVALPPSLEPILWKFDFSNIWSMDMLIILFTFLFVDFFDTVGTLIGVSSKAGMLDKEGNIPRVKQALFADSIGTIVGSVLGTSTVTTYVESASGVAEGGRTGLTPVATAVMFGIALFFAPVFTMVPEAATAPALILVGFFMMSPILNIDFDDYTESLPAFITIIIMPLTFSIADGIVFGMLSYVLLKVFTGKFRDISTVMVVLFLLFVLKFFF